MGLINQKNNILNNSDHLIIRTALPKDAKQILELMKDILKEKIYAIHEIDEFKETVNSYRKKINKFYKGLGKIFIVAEINNEIAVFVNFNNWDTRKTMHTGFLSIYIKKKYRGIGIGRALMEELIKWARKSKIVKKMSLAVFGNNKNAILLYKKMGFMIEGICPKDIKINGKYFDSVFMYIFV